MVQGTEREDRDRETKLDFIFQRQTICYLQHSATYQRVDHRIGAEI